jgi:hypothetical protein
MFLARMRYIVSTLLLDFVQIAVRKSYTWNCNAIAVQTRMGKG